PGINVVGLLKRRVVNLSYHALLEPLYVQDAMSIEPVHFSYLLAIKELHFIYLHFAATSDYISLWFSYRRFFGRAGELTERLTRIADRRDEQDRVGPSSDSHLRHRFD